VNEQQYFEQFAGDVLEIELVYIPFSVKEFQGFDELKKEEILAIANYFKIPMSVWLGQSK